MMTEVMLTFKQLLCIKKKKIAVDFETNSPYTNDREYMENRFLLLGFKRLRTLNKTFADKMLLTPHTHTHSGHSIRLWMFPSITHSSR